MAWQVQEAKRRFGELVRKAQEQGPQVVTRYGVEVAVLVSVEAYRRLTGEQDFKASLRSVPDCGELEVDRSPEPARVVDL